MSYALAAASVEPLSVPTSLSLWWILLPAFVGVGSGISAYKTMTFFGKPFDEWLSQSRDRRQRFRFWFLVVITLLAGIAIEAANFSSVVSGELHIGSLVAMTALCPLVAVFFSAEWVMDCHDDTWNERLDAKSEELVKQELLLKETRQHRDFLVLVDKLMRHVVGSRVQSLRDACQIQNAQITMGVVLRSLAPDLQIVRLIQMTFEIFNTELEKKNPGKNFRLRVALFAHEPEQRCLRCVHSWDGHEKECIRRHADKFSMDQQTECLAVWVAVKGHMAVVPDAIEADQNSSHPFHFFDPTQRKTIASLLAIPLKGSSSEIPAKFVLMLDTDDFRFFSEEQVAQYSALGDSLAQYLHHEVTLSDMLKLASVAKGSSE